MMKTFILYKFMCRCFEKNKKACSFSENLFKKLYVKCIEMRYRKQSVL